MTRKQVYWFDPTPPESLSDHTCDYPGCPNPAPYRAPRSRTQLEREEQTWLWFCLEHIRQYNASWNYYEGMTPDEIEKERRTDYTWKRPSWPLNERTHWKNMDPEDPFGFFADDPASPHQKSSKVSKSSTEWEAMHLLSLSYPFTRHDLRRAYRRMVKKYHPDLNPGSKEAEEMIKKVNDAYEYLKKELTDEKSPP